MERWIELSDPLLFILKLHIAKLCLVKMLVSDKLLFYLYLVEHTAWIVLNGLIYGIKFCGIWSVIMENLWVYKRVTWDRLEICYQCDLMMWLDPLSKLKGLYQKWYLGFLQVGSLHYTLGIKDKWYLKFGVNNG
jgi:hypothetical protein